METITRRTVMRAFAAFSALGAGCATAVAETPEDRCRRLAHELRDALDQCSNGLSCVIVRAGPVEVPVALISREG